MIEIVFAATNASNESLEIIRNLQMNGQCIADNAPDSDWWLELIKIVYGVKLK